MVMCSYLEARRSAIDRHCHLPNQEEFKFIYDNIHGVNQLLSDNGFEPLYSGIYWIEDKYRPFVADIKLDKHQFHTYKGEGFKGASCIFILNTIG